MSWIDRLAAFWSKWIDRRHRRPVLDQDEVRRRAEEALANALPSSPYNIPPMRVGFADPAMVGVGKPLEPEMRLVKYFFVEKTTDPYVWHDIASMVDCK